MCKKCRKFQIVVAIVFPLCNENLNTFLTRIWKLFKGRNYSPVVEKVDIYAIQSLMHNVSSEASVKFGSIKHRGLKSDGATGQGEICNSLKSENFSKSFLSHIGKDKIKF